MLNANKLSGDEAALSSCNRLSTNLAFFYLEERRPRCKFLCENQKIFTLFSFYPHKQVHYLTDLFCRHFIRTFSICCEHCTSCRLLSDWRKAAICFFWVLARMIEMAATVFRGTIENFIGGRKKKSWRTGGLSGFEESCLSSEKREVRNRVFTAFVCALFHYSLSSTLRKVRLLPPKISLLWLSMLTSKFEIKTEVGRHTSVKQ